jgi:hypothetical protein
LFCVLVVSKGRDMKLGNAKSKTIGLSQLPWDDIIDSKNGSRLADLLVDVARSR